MAVVRERGEDVRRFILEHVPENPAHIARATAEKFAISRQAVNKHLRRLVAEGVLLAEGNARRLRYKLRPLETWTQRYDLAPGLAEDVVWRQDIVPALGKLPANALDIWHYGFTEIFNNAIDHSEGTRVSVRIEKTASHSEVAVYDNGVGIFKKIQRELGLLDERHSVLELAKGKLTTDPANHTGEGIFFSSRMFDAFQIQSGGVYFSHSFGDERDWILERENPGRDGTSVWMVLNNHTSRTTKNIFEQFTSGDDLAFTKTVVPVKLAQYGEDKLVSRSQAKRLLARVERFKTVILDFSGVDSIGQAFSDEIFRVFTNKHPEIDLFEVNASDLVQQMIRRARAARE